MKSALTALSLCQRQEKGSKSKVVILVPTHSALKYVILLLHHH